MASLTCASCSKPMASGKGSAPQGQAKCHPCRRAAPTARRVQQGNHRKLRPCEVCGAQYRPTYQAQRSCGRVCGRVIQYGYPQSVVDWRYCEDCDGWTTRQSRHKHAKPAKDRTWMTRPIECPVCGDQFTNQFTTIAIHCSIRCSRKASRLRRRVREAGSYGDWRWSDFMRIARKFGYCCAYCGEKPARLDPDHVVPLSKGGPNVLANLLPTCQLCNSDKCARSLAEWDDWRHQRGKTPRRTSWTPDDTRYWHLTYGLPHQVAA
jgi:hypothetical protein